MVNVIIGILMILSFIGMIYYCVRGHNLMIGFFVMSTLWVVLVLIGNQFNGVLGEGSFFEILKRVAVNVYQEGPEGYAKSILVNVFFGAFFGRVLMDTGIAATLIRKTVELGGDRPGVTMVLLCIAASLCFTSMTGIGPVISIAVIVMPILLALGIPSAIALFAFMGSIMAGILLNITNFQQYQGIVGGMDDRFLNEYAYGDYFMFGLIAMVVALVVVLAVALFLLRKAKAGHAWAASAGRGAQQAPDAPFYSWISVILPVILVVAVQCPIILAFCISALYALLTCGKMKGGFANVCTMLARQFADGAVDVAPMVGFLLTLAMFNNAAVCFGSARLFPRPDKLGRMRHSHRRGGAVGQHLGRSVPVSHFLRDNHRAAALGYHAVLGGVGSRLHQSGHTRVYENVDSHRLGHRRSAVRAGLCALRRRSCLMKKI